MKQGRKLSIFLPNVSHRTRSESFQSVGMDDFSGENGHISSEPRKETDNSEWTRQLQEVGEILPDYAFTLMFFKAVKTFSRFVGIFAEKKNNNFIVFANFIMIVDLDKSLKHFNKCEIYPFLFTLKVQRICSLSILLSSV